MIETVLCGVAFVLSAISLIKSDGKSELAWAVVLLSAASLVPVIR